MNVCKNWLIIEWQVQYLMSRSHVSSFTMVLFWKTCKKSSLMWESSETTQMLSRRRDVSLNIYFLKQCHMVFHHGPAPLGDRKQSWVHSFLWEKWAWSHIMTNSFTPLSLRSILDPFYARRISSEHSDTKMAFFWHTNQEKINFVPDTSLSQWHTLTKFGNRFFPPCFTTDINGHLNGLIGETMN